MLFGGRPDISLPDSEKLCLIKEGERICPPVVKGDASRFLDAGGRSTANTEYYCLEIAQASNIISSPR